MPTTLTTNAQEKSTYIINAEFKDEDDNLVTPKAGMQWDLTDSDGNIINSRDDVDVVEATDIDIVLSGDDLQVKGANDDRVRVLTLVGTYDSAAGSDLPLKDSCRFTIDDLIAVT